MQSKAGIDKPIQMSSIDDFQQYYTSLYAELMFFLKRYIEDEVLREDLLQDVWLKIWECQKSFSNELAFKTYVYRSMRNAAISHIRKQDHSNICSIDCSDCDNNLINDDNILSEIIEAEVYAIINSAFDELSDSCKRIYIERLNGKTHKEIAQTFDITINTVKKHINNANHALKKKLPRSIFSIILVTLIHFFCVFILKFTL